MKNNVIFLTGLFSMLMFSVVNVNAESNSTDNQNVTIDSIKRLNPDTLFDAAPYAFSQVVIPPEGTTVYISGQGAIDVNGNVVGDTLEEQLPIVFQNLKFALEASGSTSEHIVKAQIFIADYQQEQLEIYLSEAKKFFGNDLPASILIPVPRLALDDMLVEIDVTVVIPN
ncbi:MAG: RidA family protein [Nitrososphaeraceae archaeon]